MNREKKQEHMEFLKDVFGQVESVVLTSVEGLTVAEVTDLRRQLHGADVQFRVIKNKIAAIAVRDLPVSVLGDDFVGSTAMAWSNTDAIAPAKVLVDYAKGVEKFGIKAGYNAGRRLSVEELKVLAALPSLPELRAKLLGTIQGVASKLLAQVNAPGTHVVGVLQARVDDQKEAA